MSMNGTAQHHTITALVRDKPGVLNRVSSMFRRRGFNIVSLAVGHSEEPDLSRMTFVVEGDKRTIEQVNKHLHKLIDVIRVAEVSSDNVVSRELALIKIRASSETRSEIIQIVEIFNAKIAGVSPDHLIVEVTGDQDKIESLLGLVKTVRHHGGHAYRHHRHGAMDRPPPRSASREQARHLGRGYIGVSSEPVSSPWAETRIIQSLLHWGRLREPRAHLSPAGGETKRGGR